MFKQKYQVIVVLSLLLAVIMLTACSQTPSPASPASPSSPTSPSAPEPVKTVTLRLAHDSSLGPAGSGPYHLKEAGDEVAALTDGRVKFEYYWMESLNKKPEALDAVKVGTADITEISPGSFFDKIPLVNVTAAVPFEPASIEKCQKAFSQIMGVPEILAEWDEWNVKVIGADLRQPKRIVSSVPIYNLADVNGVKIRENSEANIKIWAAAGGVASYVAIPEVYESIQRGVIQGLGADLGIVLELKLNEVCKYFHENLGFGAYLGFIVMNQDSLSSLSPNDQQILLDSFGKMASRQIEVMKANNDEYLQRSGMEVIHFSDEDLAKWRNMPEVKSIVTDWVDQMNGMGLAGTKVMNDWLNALGLDPI